MTGQVVMQSDQTIKKEINNNYTHYTDMHMLEQYLIIMKTIKRCSQIILDLLYVNYIANYMYIQILF